MYRLSRRERRDYFLKSFLVLFLCGYVFYGNFIVASLSGLLSVAGLPAYRKSLVEKRRNELKLEFKDLLYSVSSSVSSGRHLNEALADSEASVSLIHGEDSILSREIRNMCRIMRETHCGEEEVLQDFSTRAGVREITDFTDVCIICKYTGGDLVKMIEKAVALITQNIELQKEKEVMLSQKKLESKILAAMPIVVTGIINITSPDYLEVMYTTLAGRLIMTAAMLGTLASYLWSMKMIRSDVQVAE